MKDRTEEIKHLLEVKTGHEVSIDNTKYLIAGWQMSGKDIDELLPVISGEKVEYSYYSGFATPTLLLEGSDTKEKGYIIDTESSITAKDAQGLMCGWWNKGWNDDLIHLCLCKPIAAICDERQAWINQQTFLKEPISMDYSASDTPEENPRERKPHLPTRKRKLELDPETKQFRMV